MPFLLLCKSDIFLIQTEFVPNTKKQIANNISTLDSPRQMQASHYGLYPLLQIAKELLYVAGALPYRGGVKSNK